MDSKSEPTDQASLVEGASSRTAIGVGILATFATLGCCYFVKIVFIPIVLSFFMFILLDPWVGWFDRLRMSRKLTSPIVILLFISTASLLGWAGFGTLSDVGRNFPQYTQKIRGTLTLLQKKLSKIQSGASTLLPKSSKSGGQNSGGFQDLQGSLGGYLLGGLNSLLDIVGAAFLIPLLTLFLLLEKEYLSSQLRLAIEPSISLDFLSRELNQMVTGFFLGNLVVGFLTSAGFLLLFSILGLDNSIGLSLFSGFINLIPILGAVLGALLPLAQCFLQFSSATPALIVVGSSVFLHLFVANFIMPKIVGSRINVNASAALIGLVIWGWIWGAIGLLLAIPLMALIRIFMAATPAFRKWSNMISENPLGPVTKISFSTRKKHTKDAKTSGKVA